MADKINPDVPKSNFRKTIRCWGQGISILLICMGFFFESPAFASGNQGEQVYKHLSDIANSADSNAKIKEMFDAVQSVSWEGAEPDEFVGNLRVIRTDAQNKGSAVYLLRKLTGEVYVLSVPGDPSNYSIDADGPYAGLDTFSKNKMRFKIQVMPAVINGQAYTLAKFTSPPEQVLMDKIFKICIILMLFFVMVGMGMTLTLDDFALVFKKPKGIILGQILQFGVMPLLAVAMGHLLGFHEAYPFIFVGMVLITAIPGGVTSNLMTYYAKGDLALSISLTSFSTVLSIVFTPLLLTFYCSNMPEVLIPVNVVIQTILVLVIVPLAVGMGVRKKWAAAAKRATPFFSALGIISLFVLIVAGIVSNLNMFADTARYGLKFYTTIFIITMTGMLSGILVSKIFGLGNYQTRAISLETGLRNSALAMTIAILIQDAMGDFYSSMFVTSGIFGLVMYLSGSVSIFLYKYILPLGKTDQ
jgi:BASS family bile acid:Na+ symporter